MGRVCHGPSLLWAELSSYLDKDGYLTPRQDLDIPGHLMIHSTQDTCPVVIRKTCPCNEYPLKPHFYIVKLGYAGVYLFFLFLLQNIDCGYSLEPPRRGGSNVYPQSMF